MKSGNSLSAIALQAQARVSARRSYDEPANTPDSYREYLKIRGASIQDPLVPEVRKSAGD